MSIKIVIGDPFSINVAIHDNDANTILNISNNYTVSFNLSYNNTEGQPLSGLNYFVSNNIISLMIANTDTATYPVGLGVLAMKVASSDQSVIIRHKEVVRFIQEDII